MSESGSPDISPPLEPGIGSLNSQKYMIYLGAALVALFCVIAYGNSFNGPFIFDDIRSIPKNPTITHLWPITIFIPKTLAGATVDGRPFLNFTLAINYALGGLSPWGYHLFNFLIHMSASLTLMGLVRRTLLRPPLKETFGPHALVLAVGTALLWLTHPLTTNTVTYIIQRAESLVSLIYLLTLYAVARSADSDHPERWRWLSVATCFLGMASKEIMVTAPFAVLLYDRAFISGSFKEALRKNPRYYLALAASWLVLAVLMLGVGDRSRTIGAATNIPMLIYARTQLWAVSYYLKLAFAPHPLIFDYGYLVLDNWTKPLIYGSGVMALLFITLWQTRVRPASSFALLMFFIVLSPTSTIFPIIQPVSEHRMYLPLAGITATVVCGLYYLWKRYGKKAGKIEAWTGIVVFGCIIVLTTTLTRARNEDFRTSLSIWEDTVQKFPSNPRGQYNYGYQLYRQGRFAEAVPHLGAALERLWDEEIDQQVIYGRALLGAGMVKEARVQLKKTLEVNPLIADSHYYYARALMADGEYARAEKEFQEALKLGFDTEEIRQDIEKALEEGEKNE